MKACSSLRTGAGGARRCLLLCLAVAFLILPAPTSASAQVEGHQYELRVSEDGRFIVRSDGTPFFWLGDTAWELFHRTTRGEADLYLTDRAGKGFSVIQAVVLAELDGLNTPNAYGHVPLEGGDPMRPVAAYFEHVDYIVSRAESLGMYVGMLPTWGDKFNRRWGVGPEVFSPVNARAYGAFLGARYAGRPIIWILGGDRIPEEDEDLEIIREMALGIREGGGDGQLMTYHPMGGRKSWEWFHDDVWLDVHLFQSGHGAYDIANYEMTREGYRLEPPRPVIDGEPRYEDHPVNWRPENGWFDAFDVRQAAYWSMLSGAAGHTYGDHNIWQMWQPGREPISSARTPWKEALSHPGSTEMGHMRRMFETRDWMRLAPDQDLVVGDVRKGAAHVRAARAVDGSYAYVYVPYGDVIEVDLGRLDTQTTRASWFDPRIGTYHEVDVANPGQSNRFDPPGESGRGNDWVLVLERAR